MLQATGYYLAVFRFVKSLLDYIPNKPTAYFSQFPNRVTAIHKGAYSDLLEQQMRKHLNRSVEHLNTYPQAEEIPMHQNSPCMGKEAFSVVF